MVRGAFAAPGRRAFAGRVGRGLGGEALEVELGDVGLDGLGDGSEDGGLRHVVLLIEPHEYSG